MKIIPQDRELLRTFLKREMQDYLWADGVRKGRNKQERQDDFISEMEKAIDDHLEKIPAADFIVIDSISNLGLTQRSLHLSGDKFEFGTNVVLNLPPGVNGSINCSLQPRFPKNQ